MEARMYLRMCRGCGSPSTGCTNEAEQSACQPLHIVINERTKVVARRRQDLISIGEVHGVHGPYIDQVGGLSVADLVGHVWEQSRLTRDKLLNRCARLERSPGHVGCCEGELGTAKM